MACALCGLGLGCPRPNELFFAATDMSPETSGELRCPDIDPRIPPVELCEIGGQTPVDLGDLPALAAGCGDDPVTIWARRRAADPTRLDPCGEACGACTDSYPLDPADPRHDLLTDPAILPPDACLELAHAGARGPDDRCTTTRLAVWVDDEPVPRLAAGVDDLRPIDGTGLELRYDDAYACSCADADKLDTTRFPCCAASDVRYYDVLVTPDGDCPVRVRRGPAHRRPIVVRGEPREFTLHDAYEYFSTCHDARRTHFWSMTPG